ncbi:MAG: aminoglycoside phosphotransferase family protein [Catenulispora sp.]|nr:aminoglycoside phosphotransferase family protein [Catenulispora sp.]
MDHDETALRPLTAAWVSRHLAAGERIVSVEALHGGITAEMRKLTIGTQDGGTRDLVLRTFVDAYYVERAEDSLSREASALTQLIGSGVPVPALVGADPRAVHCEYPSLLMTHLAGRAVLDDVGLEARVPVLARQLVAIHAVRAVERPREFVTLTRADTVVVPSGADAATWAAAINMLRKPAPSYEGRFLHRDFQPGNVLFDVSAPSSDARITGVVDWAAASWGPADLDVAHCCTNLALVHGPWWGQRFADAYEQAGGVLAADAGERLYWQVRDALASSEEVQVVAQAWREAGRADLTTRAVEKRLDAYVRALMDAA